MAHGCFVRGDTAYVACGGSGFAVVDVRDKANPTTLTLVSYEDAICHSMWLTEDGTHLLHGDEKIGGRLTVWDVRDLSRITRVGTFETAPEHMIHNVYVQGDLAFLSPCSTCAGAWRASWRADRGPPEPISFRCAMSARGGPAGALLDPARGRRRGARRAGDRAWRPGSV
jgi:hypothetical protein